MLWYFFLIVGIVFLFKKKYNLILYILEINMYICIYVMVMKGLYGVERKINNRYIYI